MLQHDGSNFLFIYAHVLWVSLRKVAKYCENYLRSLASTTVDSLEKTVNIQEVKFTNFEVYQCEALSMCNLSSVLLF